MITSLSLMSFADVDVDILVDFLDAMKVETEPEARQNGSISFEASTARLSAFSILGDVWLTKPEDVVMHYGTVGRKY